MSSQLSIRTLKVRRTKRILGLISILLVLIPIVAALCLGFLKASHSGKYALTLSSIASLILLVVGFATKHKLQDVVICLLVVVFYYTCNKAIPIVIVYIICALIDRLIITPLHNRFETQFIAAKEIDKHNEV